MTICLWKPSYPYALNLPLSLPFLFTLDVLSNIVDLAISSHDLPLPASKLGNIFRKRRASSIIRKQFGMSRGTTLFAFIKTYLFTEIRKKQQWLYQNNILSKYIDNNNLYCFYCMNNQCHLFQVNWLHSHICIDYFLKSDTNPAK